MNSKVIQSMMVFLVLTATVAGAAAEAGTSSEPKANPNEILLRNYRPHSIFKIPETRVEKARFLVVDMHSHDYAATDEQLERWVQTMDAVGLKKTVILSGSTGSKFDELLARYRRYPGRFDVWCGIDYTGFAKAGYGPLAVAELVRCRKGRGLGSASNTFGMHIDDPRLDAVLEKCAELRMPINIHVGEDKWMYEPMDETNDGLMNAWHWKVPNTPGVLQQDEVVATLERALGRHPHTVFIACHFANCCSDLNRLGTMFDSHTNLFADMGARFAEIAPIPRFVAKFFDRYQDRLLYGTDNHPDPEMYRTSFRLLETADEHFYPNQFANYHWAFYGFALPEPILKKIYYLNAATLLHE